MGSYLRTNYRISGRELDIDAIGGGLGWNQGSYISGAGIRRMYGGFIWGSWADSLADSGHIGSYLATGMINISTYGAMSQYYGDGMFGAGYKFVPLVAWEGSVGAASKTYFYQPWLSYFTSNADGSAYIDSIARIRAYRLSADASVGNSIATPWMSVATVRIIYAGFIVSAP